MSDRRLVAHLCIGRRIAPNPRGKGVKNCVFERRWGRWSLLAVVSVLLMGVGVPRAAAKSPTDYTEASVIAWMHEYAHAKPEFKPGDVLTIKDVNRIRPFIPPGYIAQFDFPQFKMRIIAPRDHTPRKDYQACTEKYQSQVRLKPDRTLANYVCGQPFPDSSLSTSDPSSGMKAAWNFEYRWQNYGQFSLNYLFILDRFGGNHTGNAPNNLEMPPQNWIGDLKLKSALPRGVAKDFGGGGHFTRIMSTFYRRVYFSHLAQRSNSGGLLDTPDAKDILWKEFTGFFSPYDVRGQVFITYRYANPRRADDAWAYDPRLRRVRRVSVEVKSDSVAGTDTTQEDFYSFSGRPLHWHWKFLGWKDVLAILDSKYDTPRLYGPNGDIPDDQWSLRRFAVIERTPFARHHPYTSVVMFWDSQDWYPWMSMAFDRKGKLWKTWEFQSRWSEDFKTFVGINHGVRLPVMIGESTVDLQNKRATVFAGYGTGYPAAHGKSVSRLYDISRLEEMHR